MNLLTDGNITSVVTSSLSTVGTQVTEVVMAVVPAGIAIAGIYIVVRSGIRIFKSVAK